jgi:hypothetical protein
MPRLAIHPSLLARSSHSTLPSRHILPATVNVPHRHFASTDAAEKGTQNSRPGWSGRFGDDHAVERDRHDVQGDASQEGMKKFEEEKQSDQPQSATSGQAISRKDERNSNQKAKKEHPEAPGVSHEHRMMG